MTCNCYYWTLKFHQCKALAGQPVGEPARTPIPFPDDVAYQFSVCLKCGERWQNLDYGCARHANKCGYPLPPKAAAERTSRQDQHLAAIQTQKDSL
jgi:hypothetical protein